METNSIQRRIFKIEYEVIILSIVYGLLFWILDALIDHLYISRQSFWELFILNLPAQKICMRLAVMGGFTVFGVFIAKNLAQRKKAEEKIAYMATHDPLTGLPNRWLFGDRLTIALAQARRIHKKVALILLDLDQFKNVNDTLGHKAGDELLKSVANRFKEILRETDTVARMAGDEFLFLISGITWIEDALFVCRKIQETLQKPFVINGTKVKISASMGVAIYPHDGKDGETLIKNADIAMYYVKNKNQGKFQRYNTYMQSKTPSLTSRNTTSTERINEFKSSLQMLQKSMADIIHTIARIVQLKDPYTGEHQRKVTRLSCNIAKEMGLSKEQINGLRFAATIHDIGKINVPAEILNRPGELRKAEREMIRDHPRLAYDILRQIDFPWPVAEIVLQHHERLDGSGYPQGLKDDKILLEARILAVADVVEAMSSHRPYRASLGIEKALEEISKNKGKLYDSQVVDTCLKLFKEKGFKFL